MDGGTGKCVPLKGDFPSPVCVTFTPEGEDPPKDALGCEQVEMDGVKGTGCLHLDDAEIQPAQENGVPTERSAARFAPRPAPGADLTDEQKVQLEEVRREIAPDETGKSSDEALAGRLSKSSTVGTIVSAMFMFNPLVKILYTAGAFSFLSEMENQEPREENAALDVVAKPVDGTVGAESATEAGEVSDSRVVPEGSIAIPVYEDIGGRMRVKKDVLKLVLFYEAPLAALAPESRGGIIVFVEEQAAKNPGANKVIVKISDILGVGNKELLEIKRVALPDPMSSKELKELKELEEKANELADKAKSGGGKRGGRGGKRTGKGKKAKKAKKAKKKSGGGMYDDF